MYEIKRGNLFKSSYKRVLSSKSFSIERFERIIIYLQKNEELPDIFHDHALAGNFIPANEDHVNVCYIHNVRATTEQKVIIPRSSAPRD